MRLLIGCDDLARVWINGQEVYRCAYQRGFREDEDAVENISLKAGVNAIVFKVINIHSRWLASLRFTDQNGNPAKGLHSSLNPSSW